MYRIPLANITSHIGQPEANAEADVTNDVTLPVMTTGRHEPLVRESATALGLVVDIRTNYAQKGGGPLPLIIDLETFIRSHGPSGWQLLEGAAASWAVKKAADSLWGRVVALVRDLRKRSPDGVTLQVVAVDRKEQKRHYRLGSNANLDDAITQLALDLDAPGAPGERLWVDGRWMPSSEYFKGR